MPPRGVAVPSVGRVRPGREEHGASLDHHRGTSVRSSGHRGPVDLERGAKAGAGTSGARPIAAVRDRLISRASAPQRRRSASTTGAIRSTQSAYWAPLGCRPSRGDERPVAGGAERQVERVDEGDPPVGREARHRRVDGDDPVVLLARIAVVGAGRASPCSRASRRSRSGSRARRASSASRIRSTFAA